MKNKQKFLKPCLVLLLLLSFSMLVIGCGKNGESKAQVEKEGKQITEKNIANTSVENTVEVSTPKMTKSHSYYTNRCETSFVPTPPKQKRLQMEEWKQLLGDLRNVLGDIQANDLFAKGRD
jgi:hypothetical protein